MSNEINFEGPTQEWVEPVQEQELAPASPKVVVEEDQIGEFLAAIEPPSRPEAPNPPKTVISLDNTPDQVLSLDLKGLTLYFEDEPGRFLDLDETIFQKLSLENKNRYLVSQGMNARLVRAQAHPELQATPGLKVTPGATPMEKRRNTATAKLHVSGLPGMHYAWPLADEVGEFEQEGYKVTTDPRVKTFGGEVGSSRRVVKNGEVEHVLMEIPDPTFQATLKRDSDISKQRGKGVEDATRRDILRGGGLPLDEKSRVAGNFGRITPEGPVA